MGILEIVLIIFEILFLFGGGYGYRRRTDWGNGPVGISGLLVTILLVVLILRLV